MENQELFKQAILDARSVRETAMAAAKATLAEHFEPYIKETMEKELTKEEDEAMEEAQMHDEMKMHHGKKMHDEADHSTMDEATLDEILAELDGLTDETVEEGHVPEDGYDHKAKPTHGDGKLHEAEDDEDDDDDVEADDEDVEDTPGGMEDMEAGEGGDEQEVVDITVGDLKDIIRDVFMQLQGGGDMGPALDAGTDLAADLGTDEEKDEISLEEILAELEEEERVAEAAGASEIPGGRVSPAASDVHNTQYDETKKDLKEAVRTIKALKSELNEINLFSAKLLYVNKIFKAKNLSESQKTKVINAFDRAVSVKEVENTYKTLLESISSETKKSSLRESVGFASKPIGHAPARPIVEADAFVTRWQQLAGIK